MIIAVGIIILSISVYHMGYSDGYINGNNDTISECTNLIRNECPDLWSRILIGDITKNVQNEILYE